MFRISDSRRTYSRRFARDPKRYANSGHALRCAELSLVQATWAVIDTFAYCLNHTSPAAVSILMCMGGEPYSSSDNHSIINLVLVIATNIAK